MGQLNWSESALIDFQEAVAYVARDSRSAARQLRIDIHTATRKLRKMPRLGSMVPEIEQENIRELYVHPYRVMYKILENDNCLIVAILHSHRGINRFLSQRGLLPPDSPN